MKIVVTGALGHIGSRFIREIPKAFPGAEVLLIDNMLTQRYSALFGLPFEASFRFVEADIMKAPLEELFAGADAVVAITAVQDLVLVAFEESARVVFIALECVQA